MALMLGWQGIHLAVMAKCRPSNGPGQRAEFVSELLMHLRSALAPKCTKLFTLISQNNNYSLRSFKYFNKYFMYFYDRIYE